MTNIYKRGVFMTIRALSFDFDGCLYNIQSRVLNDIIQSNLQLFNTLKKENEGYQLTYSFIGSSRQSYYWDFMSSHSVKTPLCFLEIEKFCNALGTQFNPFLQADIHGDLDEGVSFNRAKQFPDDRSIHINCPFDKTKVSLIYAQIHNIALKHPNESIIFDFFDDDPNSAIFKDLCLFYTKNIDFIPANVTLKLNQYTGNVAQLIHSIQGTGFIDKNYRLTVKDLWTQASSPEADGFKKSFNVAERAEAVTFILPNRLKWEPSSPVMAFFSASPENKAQIECSAAHVFQQVVPIE